MFERIVALVSLVKTLLSSSVWSGGVSLKDRKMGKTDKQTTRYKVPPFIFRYLMLHEHA